MIYTETGNDGTTYKLCVDPNLVHEAEAVLTLFSTPARELVIRNQYGPREARFAGAVMQCSMDLVSLTAALKAAGPPDDETDAMEDQITQLSALLAEAAQIIEDRVAGCIEQVATYREAIEAAEDYTMDIEDGPMEPLTP